MSTWHQDKGGCLLGLYDPHATSYKVISDKPGQLASSILLPSLEAAQTYVKNAGGSIIPPLGERNG